MNRTNYLKLKEKQIQQLERQYCTANHWDKVWISAETDIARLQNVHFSGEVYLGAICGSYLIEEKGQTILVPAINLKSVGTVRDAHKWPNRDRRHEDYRNNCMNFNLLNPFTIDKMYQGRELLQQIEELSDTAVKEYNYRGLKIYRQCFD